MFKLPCGHVARRHRACIDSESLSSLRGDAVKTVISKGRTATQMPVFEEILPQDQIEALAKFVTTPLAEVPS